MKYVSDRDFSYIASKYHDATKPFDPHNRFIRRDEIFDSETGIDGDALKAGILKNDEAYRKEAHPVRKARALAYVLAHTRISCDARDRFPAVNALDRPISSTLIGRWSDEVFGHIIPEVEKARAELYDGGIATVWPDYDHSVPNWDRVFALGFSGILRESEEARKKHTLTWEEDAFFEGIRITYEAIIAFVARLEKRAAETNGSHRLADALGI